MVASSRDLRAPICDSARHSGRTEDGVLKPGFITHCGCRRAAQSDRERRKRHVADCGAQFLVKGDRLTVEHPERYLVDMNRVSVRSRIENLPDLDCTRPRSLYYFVIPELRLRQKSWTCTGDRTESGLDATECIPAFVQ